MLGFFIVVCGLWSVLHGYVALRLVAPLPLSRRAKWLVGGLFVPPCLLSPLVFNADALFAPPWTLVFRWVAWTYVGGFSVLFSLMVLRDALLAALFVGSRWRTGASSGREVSVARRRFLERSSAAAALLGAGTLTAAGVRRARKPPELRDVEIRIPGLPEDLDGYHIVQLSDMHVGETIDKDFILPIIETVTTLKPDLVALTGDMVDGSVDRLRADVSPLAYLRARDGVCFVTGNHEYYSGAAHWCDHFRELGMTVLNNHHLLVKRGDARLLVAGVTDYREGKKIAGHRSDPELALKDAPPHDVRILLAHQPRSADAAKQLGFALQLSGHTHGGQFFPWNLLVGLIEPLRTGLSKVDDMWVYVSRGTCYWGPPLRTMVAPEISSLRLRRA